MTEMSDTMKRLRHVLTDHFGPATEASIKDDDDPWSDGAHLKSIDRLEFMMRLEEEFSIEIPDAIAEQKCSLIELARLIDALKPSTNAY